MADKGFLIRKVRLLCPGYCRGPCRQFKGQHTRRVASLRTHVERNILKLKQFRILFLILFIYNNNYITITEYICYKTYNLQHNIESTLSLLNYEFEQNNTNKILFYIILLQYFTYCTRHYLLTKPYVKLLHYLQCAILLTCITDDTLHYLTYGCITYLTYVIFLTYTRHLHWKN